MLDNKKSLIKKIAFFPYKYSLESDLDNILLREKFEK